MAETLNEIVARMRRETEECMADMELPFDFRDACGLHLKDIEALEAALPAGAASPPGAQCAHCHDEPVLASGGLCARCAHESDRAVEQAREAGRRVGHQEALVTFEKWANDTRDGRNALDVLRALTGDTSPPGTAPAIPPWVVFDRKDGTADVLPAGRLGAVLARLPLALAEEIVDVANRSPATAAVPAKDTPRHLAACQSDGLDWWCAPGCPVLTAAAPQDTPGGAAQSAVDAFNAHLDECEQCREHPFDLCPMGVPLLRAAGGATPGGTGTAPKGGDHGE